MTSETEPEIILYDLACIKKVCFSPTVWRIRLMLNYKKIPYRTIFLEFPDIKPTLKGLGMIPSENAVVSYTVPAIHHTPTNTYMMDSAPIAQFLESTYPDSPVPLTSALGEEIQAKARYSVGGAFRVSILPREMTILSPRAQEYYRRTREASLGHRLEDLLDEGKEKKAWREADEGIRMAGELLRTNKANGAFILGAKPSYHDFFIAGSLQSARVVNEEIFQKMTKYPGYGEIYEACLPYMERKI